MVALLSSEHFCLTLSLDFIYTYKTYSPPSLKKQKILSKNLFQLTVITVNITNHCRGIVVTHPVFDGKNCAGSVDILKKGKSCPTQNPRSTVRSLCPMFRIMACKIGSHLTAVASGLIW